MTQPLTCASCGEVIEQGRYHVAGIDMRQAKASPPCVYVCEPPAPCAPLWAKAHPGGILWPDKATPTIPVKAAVEARGAFLDAKGQKSPQKPVTLKFAHHSQGMMAFDAILEDV